MKAIDESVIKILRCPINRNHRLRRSNTGFICLICKRNYPSKLINDVEVPNLLVEKSNWIRGYRGLPSGIIKSFQKETKVPIYTKRNKFVLDIGCGENPRGNINIDCYVPEKIPNNFILANAEYLPFKNNSINKILSYYNIEHLINPAIFIKNAFDISSEKLEIVTDNSEWFGDVVFRIIGSGRIFHDEHNYKWSIEYMENLLKRIGIKKAKVKILNLSSTPMVKFISKLGQLPRIGNFFYRDLMIVIKKS